MLCICQKLCYNTKFLLFYCTIHCEQLDSAMSNKLNHTKLKQKVPRSKLLFCRNSHLKPAKNCRKMYVSIMKRTNFHVSPAVILVQITYRSLSRLVSFPWSISPIHSLLYLTLSTHYLYTWSGYILRIPINSVEKIIFCNESKLVFFS